MSSLPAPVIGLQRAHRASGEPYLVGIAPAEFVIPAGARVQLRRLRDDAHENCGASHVLVFEEPTDATIPVAEEQP